MTDREGIVKKTPKKHTQKTNKKILQASLQKFMKATLQNIVQASLQMFMKAFFIPMPSRLFVAKGREGIAIKDH